jgi:hypothetical protein
MRTQRGMDWRRALHFSLATMAKSRGSDVSMPACRRVANDFIRYCDSVGLTRTQGRSSVPNDDLDLTSSTGPK